MNKFILVSLVLFCFGCASKSLVTEETQRSPASNSSSNVQALKEVLMSAQSDCKIAIKENDIDLGPYASLTTLSVSVTPVNGAEKIYVVVGNPEMYLTRYYSNSDKRFKYSAAFKGNLLDSDIPSLPNRIEVVAKEGKFVSLSISQARSNLDDQGQLYGRPSSLCKLTQ